MKREYSRPTVEKLHFNYRDQVVAASGGGTSAYAALENETPQQMFERIFADGQLTDSEVWEIVSAIFKWF